MEEPIAVSSERNAGPENENDENEENNNASHSEKSIFACPLCRAHVTHMKRHLQSIHSLKKDRASEICNELRRQKLKSLGKEFKLCQCGRSYTTKFSLKRHERNCTGQICSQTNGEIIERKEDDPFSTGLKCTQCKIRLSSAKALAKHYGDLHDKDSDFTQKTKRFDTEMEFKIWIERALIDHVITLNIHTRKKTANSVVERYRCHRVRARKINGKVSATCTHSTEISCTAFMKKISHMNGVIDVEYVFTHSHYPDASLLRLAEGQKEEIARCLRMKKSVTDVRSYLLEKYESEGDNRMSCLMDHDVRNVKSSLELFSSGMEENILDVRTNFASIDIEHVVNEELVLTEALFVAGDEVSWNVVDVGKKNIEDENNKMLAHINELLEDLRTLNFRLQKQNNGPEFLADIISGLTFSRERAIKAVVGSSDTFTRLEAFKNPRKRNRTLLEKCNIVKRKRKGNSE